MIFSGGKKPIGWYLITSVISNSLRVLRRNRVKLWILLVLVISSVLWYPRHHRSPQWPSIENLSSIKSNPNFPISPSHQSHDPRSLLAFWLDQINHDPQISLPFNWVDLLDLQPSQDNCFKLFRRLGIHIPRSNVSMYCQGSTVVNALPKSIDLSEVSVRKYGEAFLSNWKPPSQIVFTSGGASLVMQTHHQESIHLGPADFGLYQARRTIRTGSVNQVIRSSVLSQLTPQEFVFNYTQFLQRYKHSKANTRDQALLDALTYQLSQDSNSTKHFHEPGLNGGAHYDWRFFKKLEYTDYERIDILHKLSRAWFNFANSVGIKTWLAHGTLLGWYWNGMNLPWDNDLDVQMPMNSLIWLARNYNQSLVVDLDDDGGTHSYLVDVSSHIFERGKQNGANVIDARFIDIRTGFYVDITGLSYTQALKLISISGKQLIEFNQLLEPEYLNLEKSQTLLPSELNRKLFSTRAQLYNQREIYNCKNNHFYSLEELRPLKATYFEGQPVYIPSNYEQILKREYKKGLYYRKYNNYAYHPKLRLWIPSHVCDFDKSDSCRDHDLLVYYNLTSNATKIHKYNMYYKKDPIGLQDLTPLDSWTVDPWLVNLFNQ